MADATPIHTTSQNGVEARKPRLRRSRTTPSIIEASSPVLAPVQQLTPARATISAVPRPALAQITQGGAATVSADTVTISQGGATTVNAGSVDIRQGGIARAQADHISLRQGGIALARADRISVEMGGVGIALAREAQVTQGVARSIIAREVRVDQGLVGSALAGRVTFARPSGVLLLIAGRVEGPVKALLDWRGAIALGAALGLVFGLVRRR
jgi:hypothetical protein